MTIEPALRKPSLNSNPANRTSRRKWGALVKLSYPLRTLRGGMWTLNLGMEPLGWEAAPQILPKSLQHKQ